MCNANRQKIVAGPVLYPCIVVDSIDNIVCLTDKSSS